jgi:hypothetical protein
VGGKVSPHVKGYFVPTKEFLPAAHQELIANAAIRGALSINDNPLRADVTTANNVMVAVHRHKICLRTSVW